MLSYYVRADLDGVVWLSSKACCIVAQATMHPFQSYAGFQAKTGSDMCTPLKTLTLHLARRLPTESWFILWVVLKVTCEAGTGPYRAYADRQTT